MKIEQIDLTAVKSMIDMLGELKKQSQALSKQVEALQQERSNLNRQLQQQIQAFADQAKADQAKHQQQLEKVHGDYQAQLQDLQHQHEQQRQQQDSTHADSLASIKHQCNAKNQSLSEQLTQLQQEHQDVIKRIGGLTS